MRATKSAASWNGELGASRLLESNLTVRLVMNAGNKKKNAEKEKEKEKHRGWFGGKGSASPNPSEIKAEKPAAAAATPEAPKA